MPDPGAVDQPLIDLMAAEMVLRHAHLSNHTHTRAPGELCQTDGKLFPDM